MFLRFHYQAKIIFPYINPEFCRDQRDRGHSEVKLMKRAARERSNGRKALTTAVLAILAFFAVCVDRATNIKLRLAR